MWDEMLDGESPILAEPMPGDAACLVAGSARRARVHIISPGLHEIDAGVEQRAIAETGPDGRRLAMSKRSLSRFARSLRNLESPTTETRSEPMHHNGSAVAIAQSEFAQAIVQGLAAHGTRLSIRQSETTHQDTISVVPDAAQQREGLCRKRHVVGMPGLHAGHGNVPHRLAEVELRPGHRVLPALAGDRRGRA